MLILCPRTGVRIVSQDIAKRAAAERALTLVKSGMTLGLGTGSTAEAFIRLLAARLKSGLDIRGVPTSERTASLATSLGIPLVSLDEARSLDLAVDGADEVDPQFRLIKGGGGALLREKLVASAARRVIILVDESKRVAKLGRFPLAVEVVAFGAQSTLSRIASVAAGFGVPGAKVTLRIDQFGEPFVTDGGNLIVDAALGAIADPPALASALKTITGVVDHGLFIGLCHGLIVGHNGGSAELLDAVNAGAT
jgi:ribose 5-phosphate isomerase A